MQMKKIPAYLQLSHKSHYHQSVGSMLRQDKARMQRKDKKRKTATFIVISVAVILATIFFSSRLGVSYIQATAPEIKSEPFVLVEFKTIYVMDEATQWIRVK